MVRTPNTLKWHSMIVWVCLSPFLAILIFLGSCAPLQSLITLPNNWDLPKSSKNMKNTSKYVFLASKCCEQLSKSGRNTHNPCAKHFFEVCIGFRATLGHIKVYKLDFEIFMIFGHSDTISSIWKSLFFHHFWWKNSIWALRNSWKRLKKKKKKKKKWSEMPSCTFEYPCVKIGWKSAEKNRFYDFFTYPPKMDLGGIFWGSKFQIGQTRSECPKITKIWFSR